MGQTVMHTRIFPLPAGANGTSQYCALTTSAGRRNQTELNVRHTFRTEFTMSHWYARVRTNPKNADTVLIVRRNGADALSVTVGSGLTGEFVDTGSVAFSAGDTGVIEGDITAPTAGDSLIGVLQALCDYGAETVQVIDGQGGHNNTASVTEYHTLTGISDWGGYSQALSEGRIEHGLTMRNLQIRLFTNGRTNDTVYSPTINGSNVAALEITVGSGLTGEFEDTTGTASVSPGDDVAWRTTTGTGTQAIEGDTISVEFVADVEGEFLWVIGNNIPSQSYAPGTSVTEYWHLAGSLQESNTPANEAAARHNLGLAMSLRLDRLSAMLELNGITADSSVELRKNGAGTGLKATMTASTTGLFQDLTTDPIEFSYGDDEGAWEFVTGATGTTLRLIYVSAVASIMPVPKLRTVTSGLAAA